MKNRLLALMAALRRDFIYNAFVGIRELAGSDLVFR